MNNLAIIPYVCLHALQIQNVKRDVVKKVNIKELNRNDIYCSDNEKKNLNNNNTDNITLEINNREDDNRIPNESTNIDDLPQQPLIDDNKNINID